MGILLTSYLTLIILFAIGWWWSLVIKNVSIIDAMWAFALIIPVGIFITYHEGDLARNLLLMTMASIWALRLGIHLAIRIQRQYPIEDPRYCNLREIWKPRAKRNFFFLFQINALLVFLLSLPFYVASQNTAPLASTEFIGLSIFIIGLIGEIVADRQLASFLRNKQGNAVCEIGLWNYSRHPNYFFEAIIWVGIYLFCAVSPMANYTIHAPLIMLFLLTKITGIPPAEKSSLKSKGVVYKRYQQTTSVFVPWFKKTPNP